MNDQNHANIAQYGSNRCDRVSQSRMATNLHAEVHAFDHAYRVRKALRQLLGLEISLYALLNRRTSCNVTTIKSGTAERRRQIYVCALRWSYRRGELNRIGWMPENENIVNLVIKERITKTSAMSRRMINNVLQMDSTGWSARGV